MFDAYCIILSTAGTQAEASRLAEMLVERKLAACVQIANISSVYRWQGQVQKEAEFLLLIKTATHLYSQVQAAIVENHSYEIPEVVQLPIVNGLDRYLGWIAENTQ